MLAEQGTARPTMDGLAERAGLGKGTVFRRVLCYGPARRLPGGAITRPDHTAARANLRVTALG